MSIQFNHVAFRVRDIDESLRFMRAILGDTIKTTIDLTANSPDTPKVLVIETKSGVLYDIFSAEAGGASPKDGPPFGVIHYCFGVDDVDATVAAALEAGAKVHTAPNDISSPDHPGLKIRVAYVYDPNGAVCEFVDHDWFEKMQIMFPAKAVAS